MKTQIIIGFLIGFFVLNSLAFVSDIFAEREVRVRTARQVREAMYQEKPIEAPKPKKEAEKSKPAKSEPKKSVKEVVSSEQAPKATCRKQGSFFGGLMEKWFSKKS